MTSVHTENEQLDTFLSKTAGLQLGQKPARVADQVLSVFLIETLLPCVVQGWQ